MDIMRKYQSGQFTWVPTERCFTTDAAQLQPAGTPMFMCLDGERHGFFIVSERTNVEIGFRIAHVEWSREQEIMSWLLRPLDRDIANDPSLSGVSCIVYND